MRPSFQGRSPERLAPRLQETKQGCGVAFWKGLLGVPDRDSEEALSLAFPGKRNHLALFGTSIFHRCGNDGRILKAKLMFDFLSQKKKIVLGAEVSPTTDKLSRGRGTVFHLNDQASSGPWARPWAGRASSPVQHRQSLRIAIIAEFHAASGVNGQCHKPSQK